MNLGILTASVSRKAGGLFESVRRGAQSLDKTAGLSIRVFGLKDSHTSADLPTWGGLPVDLFPVRGPQAFGYTAPLEKALRAASLDLLHTHGLWMHPSLASRNWARRERRPYVVSPHGMLDPWALRHSTWKKRIAGLLFQRDHLHRAACIHALTVAEAQAIREYGLSNPICVIPNGVDLPPTYRQTVDNGRKRKVLLYLGRLHPKKGLVNLLTAWQLLRRGAPSMARDWELVIAGWSQNGHESLLKTLVRQSGNEDSVHFPGPHFGADKEAAYRAADGFILPSFSEGLPVAVLEAWAHGLPVVMTAACNLPEACRAKAAIVTESDAESIRDGLLTLFSMTDAECRAMGERGCRMVTERFSWPRIATDLRTVYDWVLGGGAPPGCVITD